MDVPKKYQHLINKNMTMCMTIIKELSRIENKQALSQHIFNSIIADIEQNELIKPPALPMSESPQHNSDFSEMNVYYLGFKLRHQIIHNIEIVGIVEVPQSENENSHTQKTQSIERYDYVIPLICVDNVIYTFDREAPVTITPQSHTLIDITLDTQTLLHHCKAFIDNERKLLEEQTEQSNQALREPYEPLLTNNNELPPDNHE